MIVRNLPRLIVLLLGLCLCAVPGWADDPGIPGTSDPVFQEAVTLWLHGDDREALKNLADRAQHGNVAARLLLSEIEKLPFEGSKFLEALNRRDRVALFRAPSGTFGKRWVLVEASDSPFARLLIDRVVLVTRQAALKSLLALGERSMVLQALSDNSVTYASVDALAFDDAVGMPDAFRHLVWANAYVVKNAHADGSSPEVERHLDAARRAIRDRSLPGYLFLHYVPAAQFVDPGDTDSKPFSRLLHGAERQGRQTGPAVERLEALLLSHPWYDGIRRPCQRLCPAAPGACTRAAFAGLGGHEAAVGFGSPLESVIPTDRYLASRRADMQLVRSLNQRIRSYGTLPAIASISACLGDKLSE